MIDEDKILDIVAQAIGTVVYTRYGEVSYDVGIDTENKKFELQIFDRNTKELEKIKNINSHMQKEMKITFEIDESLPQYIRESKIIQTIVTQIEAELYN